MKQKEIVTMLILFGSVFALVGVLRYLQLYEGMEGMDDKKKEEEEPTIQEGLGEIPPPPAPPSTSGPVPSATGGGKTEVLKFSTF